MENTITLLREGNVRVIGKDDKVLFEGTKKHLVKFIEDAIYMAECIYVDIDANNIEDNELGTLAFDVYEDFTKYSMLNLGTPVIVSKSSQMMEQANQEDNDLKYMGLFKKAQREKRWEVFQETVVPVLVEKGIDFSFSENTYSYSFSSSKYGFVNFYAKANKVHIMKENKWIYDNAIQWLFKHIINK